jgi:hypothetical protein
MASPDPLLLVFILPMRDQPERFKYSPTRTWKLLLAGKLATFNVMRVPSRVTLMLYVGLLVELLPGFGVAVISLAVDGKHITCPTLST